MSVNVCVCLFRYGKLLPSLQARQFSAATGLSRMLIILGAIEPAIKGENVSEEVIQRQVRLMHTYTHITMKHAPKAVILIVQKNKK